MEKLKEMRQAKELIETLLRKYPETRDNSSYLILTYWYAQMHRLLGEKKWSTADLTRLLLSGEMTQAESISRVSRVLQNEKPSLRGKSYNKRHGVAEEVRQNINRTLFD